LRSTSKCPLILTTRLYRTKIRNKLEKLYPGFKLDHHRKKVLDGKIPDPTKNSPHW
jgi:hypothetical protein